jgi:hypothetical protein
MKGHSDITFAQHELNMNNGLRQHEVVAFVSQKLLPALAYQLLTALMLAWKWFVAQTYRHLASKPRDSPHSAAPRRVKSKP